MMKEKGKLRIVQKKLTVALVTMVLVISAMRAGCGSSTADTTPITKEEDVVDRGEEKTDKEVGAKAETEKITEVERITEEVEETEVATYETAMDWAITVDGTTPKLTIWNVLTKQGTLLENEQRYCVKEGDILVLCCSYEGEMSFYMDAPMLSKIQGTSIHKEYEFTEIPSEETMILFELKIGEAEYKLSLIIVPENATSTAFDSETLQTTQTTELSGEAWVNTLEYDEPKLVVWNDETGTKEVVEQGGKYVMQQGDTFGMYCPEGYFLYNTFPLEVATGTIVVSNVVVIEFNLPSESQNINLEAEILNPQNEFTIYDYVITTP